MLYKVSLLKLMSNTRYGANKIPLNLFMIEHLYELCESLNLTTQSLYQPVSTIIDFGRCIQQGVSDDDFATFGWCIETLYSELHNGNAAQTWWALPWDLYYVINCIVNDLYLVNIKICFEPISA